jgi:hypothetical protein
MIGVQWVSSAQSWLQPGAFEKGRVDEIPPGGILAVDSSIDESQYVGVRAQLLDGGQIGVEIAFIASSLGEMWAKVSSISQSVETVALTPSLEALAPIELERKKIVVGYAELITHTATVRSFITEGRLVHTGQTVLAEHVNRAVGVKTPQGYVVSSQRSPGPITACRCMIWAAALIARPKSRGRAVAAFGR